MVTLNQKTYYFLFVLLLNHLKKSGLDKNTLVIFTSDNGGTNITPQEPLRGNKGAFYEGGIRESFIARWTGNIVPGTVNNTPIGNIDICCIWQSKATCKQVIRW